MEKREDPDTEMELLEACLKARVKESLSDQRPPIPHEQVFAALRERHRARQNK